MNRVIKILMRRDKMSYDDAKDLVIQCQEALRSGNKNAVYDYLGLEEKYRFDVLKA